MFEQYTLPSWITDDYSDNFIKNQLAEEGVIAPSVDRAREKSSRAIQENTRDKDNTRLNQTRTAQAGGFFISLTLH